MSGLLIAAIVVPNALGLACLCGWLTWTAIAADDTEALRVACGTAFYASAFLGVVVSVIFSGDSQGLDVRPLRQFPFRRGQLYMLSFVASYAGAIQVMSYLPLVGALIPTAFASPVKSPIMTFLMILAATVYVSWGHALGLTVRVILQRRRGKELLSFAVLLSLALVSLAPIVMTTGDSLSEKRVAEYGPVVETTKRLLRPLPPALATTALVAAHLSETGKVATSAGGLVAWLGLGLALGWRAFTQLHFSAGILSAPRRARPGASTRRASKYDVTRALPYIPAEALAVASKEIRYLLRAMVGKFNLILATVLTAGAAWVARSLEEPILGMPATELLLFGLVVAAVPELTSPFFANTFAWEGGGLKLYFLTPTSLGRVLFGKNLAVWLYQSLIVATCLITWSILVAVPAPRVLLLCALIYGVGALVFAMLGNLLSTVSPVRRDISSMHNTPSNTAMLVSFIFMGGLGLSISACLLLPIKLSPGAPKLYLQPVSLVVMLAVLVVLYRFSLAPAARLLSKKREQVIDAIC